MSGRSALLTGATGFIGRHLARELVDSGWQVTALVRDPASPRLPAGVVAQPSDVDHETLVATVEVAEPEVCVHLATHFVSEHRPADVAALLEANVAFGARLADALVNAGPVPLVNTGTVWQHVGGADYEPLSLYAASKQALADVLRFYSVRRGLPVVTLTLPDTYGPDDDRVKLVPALLAAGRAGQPLDMSDGLAVLDLVHVDDVVRAFLLIIDLLRADRGVASHDGTTRWALSSGHPMTIREVVARFSAATGLLVDARWGVRPRKAVEMLHPWPAGAFPPGWTPGVDLDNGLAGVAAG